ncbi:MAG: sigma-70 family RNA polymerase sigma factor [Myxococcota bacterium]
MTRQLEKVYREHHRFVWRSLVRLGVPDHRVDDAMHDTFLVVARRLEEFEGRANLRTWLFAIAMRVAQGIRRDAARERKRRSRVAREQVEAHEPHARADAARTLREILSVLDDDQRAVFIMAELEGMTAPEIAAVVGVKVATVYSRLRLAREKLSRVLARSEARSRRNAR